MDKIQIAFQNGDYCHYEKDKIKLFSGYFRALFASKMADSSKDRRTDLKIRIRIDLSPLIIF